MIELLWLRRSIKDLIKVESKSEEQMRDDFLWGRIRHITLSLVITSTPFLYTLSSFYFVYNSPLQYNSIQIQFRFSSDSVQIQFRFSSESVQIQFNFNLL
ncbi:hypothetical protein VN97_g7523 [Penicillium thymicola]|uniref:Transmembrane protein n=1 Tax=Penicillium thymicola TaxID=293382 RepID=A0AAI9TF32_PENTH|nr:hypothetical protein VN97_g7523 [Penicillium thymicola]